MDEQSHKRDATHAQSRFSSQPATPPTKNHHGLLYADQMTIDEPPHIKYDWTIGKRLEFSCIKQFDALRRRCDVEDVFVRSMTKCELGKGQGGKSRSNFWKFLFP
jgi:1-phosphatidylinositol-3-phosphate 5-kinase